MQKRWALREKPEITQVQQLAEALNIDPVLSCLLIHRNIRAFEDARLYFRPELSHLHDPFLMADMTKAIDRIEEAFKEREKILIYGDYDVDGTTAVSLVLVVATTFVLSLVPTRRWSVMSSGVTPTARGSHG